MRRDVMLECYTSFIANITGGVYTQLYYFIQDILDFRNRGRPTRLIIVKSHDPILVFVIPNR